MNRLKYFICTTILFIIERVIAHASEDQLRIVGLVIIFTIANFIWLVLVRDRIINIYGNFNKAQNLATFAGIFYVIALGLASILSYHSVTPEAPFVLLMIGYSVLVRMPLHLFCLFAPPCQIRKPKEKLSSLDAQIDDLKREREILAKERELEGLQNELEAMRQAGASGSLQGGEPEDEIEIKISEQNGEKFSACRSDASQSDSCVRLPRHSSELQYNEEFFPKHIKPSPAYKATLKLMWMFCIFIIATGILGFVVLFAK